MELVDLPRSPRERMEIMQLTANAEYAIRAMVHLAAVPSGTVLSIREIAKVWEIPESYLRKIVLTLHHSGLVRSERGITGGINLAKRPDSITALDVVEAVQGPLELKTCVNDPKECVRAPACSIRFLWGEAQEKVRLALRSHSLAELAEIESGARSPHNNRNH